MSVFFWQKKHTLIPGLESGIFLIGYAIFRIISENFRLPDPQVGYLFGTDWATLGMLYSIPMILGGCIIVYIISLKQRRYTISERLLPGNK